MSAVRSKCLPILSQERERDGGDHLMEHNVRNEACFVYFLRLACPLSTVYLHDLSKLDNMLDYHQPRNEEHVWWRVVSHVWGQELECWDTGASAHGPRGNKTNVIRPPCSGSSLDRPRQCENCVMGKQLGNKTHKEMLTREKLVFWSITEQILGNTLSQHPCTAQHNHILLILKFRLPIMN